MCLQKNMQIQYGGITKKTNKLTHAAIIKIKMTFCKKIKFCCFFFRVGLLGFLSKSVFSLFLYTRIFGEWEPLNVVFVF